MIQSEIASINRPKNSTNGKANAFRQPSQTDNLNLAASGMESALNIIQKGQGEDLALEYQENGRKSTKCRNKHHRFSFK